MRCICPNRIDGHHHGSGNQGQFTKPTKHRDGSKTRCKVASLGAKPQRKIANKGMSNNAAKNTQAMAMRLMRIQRGSVKLALVSGVDGVHIFGAPMRRLTAHWAKFKMDKMMNVKSAAWNKATADAPCTSNKSSLDVITKGRICDTIGMLPAMNTTEPYSPVARANIMPKLVIKAGINSGNTTRRTMVKRLAPMVVAASSNSGCNSSNTGCTRAHHKRQTHHNQGNEDAQWGKGDFDAHGVNNWPIPAIGGVQSR